MKVCTKCKIAKELSEFYTDNHLKSKKTSWCKECTDKARREYYWTNHEYELQKVRDYWINNSDKRKEYQRKHKEQQRRANKLRQKELSVTNVDLQNNSIRQFNYIAGRLRSQDKKRADLISSITGEELRTLFFKQDCKCNYCKIIFNKNMRTDHKIPLSRKGDSTLDNIQFLCNACNMKKSDLTDSEYRLLALSAPEYFVIN